MAIQQNQTPQQFLTSLAVAYRPQDAHFIANSVVPTVAVPGSNFAYMEFDTIMQRQLADNTRTVRRDGGGEGGVNYVSWEATKQSGLTTEKIAASVVDVKDVEDFGQGVVDRQATRAVALHMLIQREQRAVDIFQTTGNYASSSYYTTLSGTSQWSDFENSDPEQDVENGITQIIKGYGQAPNTIIIPWEVAVYLKRHPMVKDVMIRDGGGSQSETFAGGENLFGLPPVLFGLRVVVPKAAYVSSNPGLTETQAFMWGKKVSIAHVNSSPSVDDPSFAYSFSSRTMQIMRGLYSRPEGGEYISGVESTLEKVVADRGAYLIIDAVA